jgi:outer membrane protein assembly factor BamA
MSWKMRAGLQMAILTGWLSVAAVGAAAAGVAGAGIRLFLPFFGTTPLAIDFAGPLNKDEDDDTQWVSFSFGFIQ